MDRTQEGTQHVENALQRSALQQVETAVKQLAEAMVNEHDHVSGEDIRAMFEIHLAPVFDSLYGGTQAAAEPQAVQQERERPTQDADFGAHVGQGGALPENPATVDGPDPRD